MNTFVCTVCDYAYDYQGAEKNDAGALVLFEDLPRDWTCPQCGISIDFFVLLNADRTPAVPSES